MDKRIAKILAPRSVLPSGGGCLSILMAVWDSRQRDLEKRRDFGAETLALDAAPDIYKHQLDGMGGESASSCPCQPTVAFD